MEQARISGGGVACIATMIYSTAILFPISQIAETSRQNGWISGLIALAGAYAIVWISLQTSPSVIGTRRSMPQWIEGILGPWVGRLVNVLFFLYFTFHVAIVFRHIGAVVSLTMLPQTPTALIYFVIGAPVALAVRLGIEVLTRISQIYLIVILGTFLLLAFGIAYAVDPLTFVPVFTAGVGPVLLAAVVPAAFFSQVTFVTWLAPYVADHKTLARSAWLGLGLFGAFIILVIVYAEGVFGYREVQRMLIPALSLSRAVQLGEIVDRLDVLLIGAWMLAAFVKTALWVYLACIQWAWLFGTESHRPFALPITALGGVGAIMIAENILRLSEFITIGGFAPYTFMHTFGIPLVLCVVFSVRRFRGWTPEGNGRGAR